MLPVFKTTFSKSKPKEIIDRNFKKFNEEDFKQELPGKLSTELIDSYSSFEHVFIGVLNKHALIKKKFIRDNYVPYVTKAFEAHRQISKKRCFEKYCSCDQACEFSAL